MEDCGAYCGKCCSGVIKSLLEYDTNKIVHIKSKKIGLINRVIQLAIVVYIVGYVIIYKKGYQSFDKVESSVTTKVKGTALTDFPHFPPPINAGPRIWDSSDYVIPPEENNAFFVMTNMIITPDQKQGKCPEDSKFKDEICTQNSDCKANEAVPNGHGVRTGQCVENTKHKPLKTCQVYAWCPIEVDVLPMPGLNLSNGVPLLENAQDFTVLIKNNIQFPKFKFSKRNIADTNNKSYLSSCQYSRNEEDKFCPVFRLGYMVEDADFNFDKVAWEGGVMGILIEWDCNLDLDESECVPKYSFKRLDNANAPIAKGYNFRYATYYVQNNTLHRILTKAYGIRFVVLVSGQAGKFDVVPLFLNLGSGLALLGIATVLCDIAVLYLLKKKNYYRDKKYQYVDDISEYEVNSDDDDRSSRRSSRALPSAPYEPMLEPAGPGSK